MRFTTFLRVTLFTSLITSLAFSAHAPLEPASARAASSPKKPPASAQRSLRESNTTFALKAFREVTRKTTDNVMFSPISLTIALGMVYAGARGGTAAQMAHAMNLTLRKQDVHRALGWLSHDLTARPKTSQEAVAFKMANALWPDKRRRFSDAYLNTLSVNYGANPKPLDFAGDPQGARETINGWVSDQTERRIPELLPEGLIGPNTSLVLTNAVYFNASWKTPFSKMATRFEYFYPLKGKKRTSPLMSRTATYKHMAGEGFEAVELDYSGDRLSMLAIVPERGRYQEIAARLDSKLLAEVMGGLTKRKLKLFIPRFTFESAFNLVGEMRALRMRDAFDGSKADLSGMNGARDLYVDQIIQKTFVQVDERGTEAAAATVVTTRGKSRRPPEPILKIDRPFVFLIRDKPTGTILFIGRMAEPTE